jgi:hypothetical protein
MQRRGTSTKEDSAIAEILTETEEDGAAHAVGASGSESANCIKEHIWKIWRRQLKRQKHNNMLCCREKNGPKPWLAELQPY